MARKRQKVEQQEEIDVVTVTNMLPIFLFVLGVVSCGFSNSEGFDFLFWLISTVLIVSSFIASLVCEAIFIKNKKVEEETFFNLKGVCNEKRNNKQSG